MGTEKGNVMVAFVGRLSGVIVLSCALLASAPVVAAPLTFNLEKVDLVAFLGVTYGSELKQNYVVDPSLIGDSRKVSLHVKVERENLASFLRDYLGSMGIEAVERNGIVYIGPKRDVPVSMPPIVPRIDAGPSIQAVTPVSSIEPHQDRDAEVYTPQHRPVSFLAAVANSVYPSSAFAAGPRMVLSGRKDLLAKLKVLLEDLDVQSQRVAVNATFVEVSGNEAVGRGVSAVANVLGAKLGVSLGDTTSSTVSLRNANFELVLNALNSDSRFKQVSTPRLLVEDGEQADQVVGNETPTISGVSLDKNGNPISQTTYRPSGVILHVFPKVLGSGRISMVVDGQVSSFQQTTTGVNSSPTLIKRQVKTSLTVADGEVLVIGGLSENRSVNNKSGISFLPASWGVNSGSTSNTDLVLILSASVAK